MFKVMISDLLEKLMNFTYTQIEMDSIDYPDLVYNEIEQFKSGGKIHIKKKNRGKFTASAKRAGQSVQEHARSVLNDPNATPLQKKRANFARNAAKWHKK